MSFSDGPSREGGLRRPTVSRITQKYDEKDEQQSLQEFMNGDMEDNGELESMAVGDDFAIPVVLKEVKLESALQEEKRYPESLHSFFQRQTPQLFLIQLPDTLPGQGNETVGLKKKADSQSAGEDTKEQQEAEQVS